MLTVTELKQALPKNLQSNATQAFADKINAIANDPETCELVRNNFLSYSTILTEGKFKTEDYLSAVTYATYKIMGYNNQDSYAKTFPDRWKLLALKGTSAKDISAYVAAYHKNKMVNTILEQAAVPVWLLNQDVVQKAINTQLELMTTANSEKVRCDAANSILTHLKPPETKKVEIDLGLKNQGGIGDLMATMAQLAERQIGMIQAGANAREVGRVPLLEADKIDEAEFTVVPTAADVAIECRIPEPELVQQAMTSPPAGPYDPVPGNPGVPPPVRPQSIFDQAPVDKPVESGDKPTTRRPSLFDPMGSGE